MRLDLVFPIRIETAPVEGRRITRIFIGEREVPVDAVLLEGAARLAMGAPMPEAALRRLAELGALAPAALPEGLPDRLALRPTVALDLGLAAQRVRLPSAQGALSLTVLPEQSLPIDLFVPPLRLAVLQRLAKKVALCWGALSRAAWSRQKLLLPEEARPLLEAVVREALAEDMALQLTLEVEQESPLRLRPVVPLQEAHIQYPIEVVTFLRDRDPRLAEGLPRLRHALGRPEDLAALGTLLGLLASGVHGAEAQAALGEGAAGVLDLMRGLLGAGMIVPAPPRRALQDLPGGQVQHLGHATLLARLGEDAVLVDPWLLPASEADRTPPVGPADLPPLSAIFLTHHHWDHLNLESFLRLDKRVPVYIPAQRPDAALAPRTEALLRALGFQQVRALAHGQSVAFRGGSVLALPFFGEDPTRIGWVGNCYVLEHAGRAALVHVDSATDALGRSLAATEDLAKVVARFGGLSPVFATRRQERGVQVEHGWPFLLRPSDEWAQPAENTDNGAEALAALCRAAKTGTLVLYSEGGSDAYPADTDFLRGSAPRAQDAVLQFLWDELDTIRHAVAEAGAATALSSPGDRFEIGGGALSSR